MIEILGIFSS